MEKVDLCEDEMYFIYVLPENFVINGRDFCVNRNHLLGLSSSCPVRIFGNQKLIKT